MDDPNFTDDESRQLLKLLHKFVMAYEPDVPVEVEHLANDLAMSLDVTRDEDDQMYRDIAGVYSWNERTNK